ncbi:MAG: glycosyltransferase [Limnochordaceae bacterium]|nr:glycosyltransferase [Limnochordaceae bacterium]
MQATVIIATYNRARILDHALRALGSQTLDPAAFEVVIADDASTDDTPDVVALHRRKGLPVRLLPLDHHVGAAAARNEAIRASTGELLVFIDSDIIVIPSFLEEHLASHRRWGRGIVTGPAMLIRSLDEIGRRRFTVWDWSSAPFAGGNASVRREDALAAGLFDESFGELGWEDVEFGLRLKAMGLRTRFNVKAAAYHFKPDPPDAEKLAAYAASQGRMAVHLIHKHPGAEARLATGLNPVGMAIDWLASIGDWDLRLARWVLARTDDVSRSRLRTLALKQLYNRTYFKAAREALSAASSAGSAEALPPS